MSMPTVRSSTVSCSQMARAIASRSASDMSSCSCSSSKSCMSHGRPDGPGRADDPGQRFRRQCEDLGFVENVGHLRRDAGFSQRLEPFPMNAGILILVLDLAAALLHRNGPAAFGAF